MYSPAAGSSLLPAVTLALAAAGLVTSAHAALDIAAPLLVNVNAVLVGQASPLYAVSAQVAFQQDVVVRGLDATASTWSVGGIAAVGKANLPMVRDFVRGKVDKFIDAYRSVNPKP